MSVISNTDYLIHSLRLSYLRNVDDPYGPRLISLDPSYSSNPYVLAASLADVERWPELAMPASPQVSDNEDGDRAPSFGATGLKHTQTIMGGRSGALGLRVNAKRHSSSKRLSSVSVRANKVHNFVVGDAPVAAKGDTISTPPLAAAAALPSNTAAEAPDVQIQGPTVTNEAPVTKAVQFIPKFKGSAEMEARRKMRMMARRGIATAGAPPPVETSPAPPPPPLPQVLNPDMSSSESSSDDELSDDGNESMDEGDEFDPDFAATRTPGLNSASPSEVLSPNSINSLPQSNVPQRSRSRLSPVTEHRPSSRIPNASSSSAHAAAPPSTTSATVSSSSTKVGVTRSNSTRSGNNGPEFSRRKVAPLKPQKSALSAMLASTNASGSSNPFAEVYGAISGRGETQSTNVRVYFPHARQPAGKAMELNVRKDASFEEVIGFALWTYWEEGWLPRLDEGLSADDEAAIKIRLSATGWIMRIAEDDGEVDDEFPPPDRTGKIAKFNFDAYAVLEANAAQTQQNQILESKIQRRPSRIMHSKKSDLRLNVPGIQQTSTSASTSNPAQLSFMAGSAIGSMPLSTSLGPSPSQGPQMFLRIRVADTADAVHISTTIEVSAGMYMQEVLESVCRKRKMANWKEYALLLRDASILIPLDRTVASLQGNKELLLVKRSMLNDINGVRAAGRTTDPNASIFKRMSDVPQVQYPSALDYSAAYKRYTIYRKMPMLVARQEKTLAIDGMYIHLMPPSNRAARAVFDSGKTYSYHIKSIADCEQSTKSSCIFKLVLYGAASGSKRRYDFEAETPKLATEIVHTIKDLKSSFDRHHTAFKNSSRRSKHVS